MFRKECRLTTLWLLGIYEITEGWSAIPKNIGGTIHNDKTRKSGSRII